MRLLEPSDLLGRDFDFLFVAKREGKHGQKHTDCADARHPPDMPDQREAGDDRKKCGDEAGRAVLRKLDRLELALSRRLGLRARALLFAPESVDVRNLRK